LILNRAVVAPMEPPLARAAQRADWREFYRISRQRLVWVAGVAFAALAIGAVFGQLALSLVFGHGRFGPAELDLLWKLSMALGGMWVGGAIGQVLSASFYAQGDTTTPTIVGVVGFTVGIVLQVCGFMVLGVLGIALGSTLYYLGNAGVMYLLLHHRANQARLRVDALLQA
jgi:putative peptidoglycan lipid II flippase